MKKILLTGGNGFIGSMIAENIIWPIGELEKVLIVDINDYNPIDIRDKRRLEMQFEFFRPDVVIHCAALTGVRRGELYPEDYISTNVIGTKNLIDLSEKYGVDHFINFSSSSVYGSDSDRPLQEDEPKAPKSIYGMTKLMAEQIVERARIHTTTVRPFTVYGQGGRQDQLIQRWIDAIREGKNPEVYGLGDQARGFTHVSDLVDGILKIVNNRIEKNPSQHVTYNLGGSELVSVLQVMNAFKMYFDKQRISIHFDFLPQQKGDAMFNFADITKAKNELDWYPKSSFFDRLEWILARNFPQPL